MSNFNNRILDVKSNISFDYVMKCAIEELSCYDKSQLDGFYNDLEYGINILDDDAHLNAYLKYFGKVQKTRLYEAFNSTNILYRLFSNLHKIEIYDWSCGQGIATICLLDFIKERNLSANIVKVNLIEPSIKTLTRANLILKQYTILNNTEIKLIAKTLDDLTVNDINNVDINSTIKLHLFNNTLNTDTFNLANFIHLFQKSQNGSNFIFCVSPYYSNNQRLDNFIEAINPNERYVSFNRGIGQWIDEWTISLRIVGIKLKKAAPFSTINKRIANTLKKKQLFGGYVLDWVDEVLKDSMYEDRAQALMQMLSTFDVISNKPLVELNSKIEPILAVMNNIITRGLPTKATQYIEEQFCSAFKFSDPNISDYIIEYKGTNTITDTEVFEALHVIDPRFKLSAYNYDLLDSDFEKDFIDKQLSIDNSEYLAQILEPQRWLSSLICVPDNNFGKDQRVDFALQIPYADERTNSLSGFIVEIDGKPYHSDIATIIKDERRDSVAGDNRWDTYRLNNIKESFIQSWQEDENYSIYIQNIKKNYEKTLDGQWANILQSVLSPFAIARLEVVLLQAMMTKILDIDASSWNIAVIERDVPCASLAIEDLKELYNNIVALKGEQKPLPQINLTIISNQEFINSPLHGKYKPKINEQQDSSYDLCIDISMLLRDKIDKYPIKSKSKSYFVIRTAHYQKVKKSILISESINYLPLVTKTAKGEYIDIPFAKDKLRYFLNNIFRKKDFRPGQLPILSRILNNKTTIGLLPTGGGKSLIYQLAAMLQPGVSIIVDPLISLMMDQYNSLRENRIDCCTYVNSTQKRKERNNNLGRLQNGELQFILLSPERFMIEEFRYSLRNMTEKNHIYFAYGVIDEVHCVSEWGHDFRPAYLQLGKNMANFLVTKASVTNQDDTIPIIGLTATASFDVLADVERELTLGGMVSVDSDTIVHPEMETRKELTYNIELIHTDFSSLKTINNPYVLNIDNKKYLKEIITTQKKSRLLQLLKQIPQDLYEINLSAPETAVANFNKDMFYQKNTNNIYDNAGIIFCPHAKGIMGVNDSIYGQKQGIASFLQSNYRDMDIATFVGGDSPITNMLPFKENKQNLMLATKAFGMGIDKPNVRYTININHPSSIEDFVQLAGRAGRDRKNAIAYILFDNTQYIELSKINIVDIIKACNLPNETVWWLWQYKNKFVLAEDFFNLCISNGCSEQIAKIIVAHSQHLFENVDKEIELYFHNNSFRGVYKEKLMLYEIIYNIMNVQESNITEVLEKLVVILDNQDISLKLNLDKNSISVLSKDKTKQYGYLYLDSLYAIYKYSNYPIEQSSYILNTLINILKKYPDHSAQWLNRAKIDLKTGTGIYQAMDKVDKDGYVYVIVTWENAINNNQIEYKQRLLKAINKAADNNNWIKISESVWENVNLNFINDFTSLLELIADKTNDLNWLINHDNIELYKPIMRQFYSKRDKDDTDKAIYRLSCIGLVEDVTIDYVSQTYCLKIRKRKDGEYYQNLLSYFEKYYSVERALKKINEVKAYNSKTELDKCVGYLTNFIYEILAKKRKRAVDDMQSACFEGIERGREGLKEFIYLYFNSKYNRKAYEVNGQSYSLSDDVNIDKRSDIELVNKYIKVIDVDDSGSEVDNVKHLYGAVLINLRDHTDNFALHLLRAFCLAFLGVGKNETLFNDFKTSFFKEGFSQMMDMYELKDIMSFFDEYIKIINDICHDDIIASYLKDAKSKLLLIYYGNWYIDFSKRYTAI